ncbi:MAG TPA: mechanosensitive ion channel [Thermoplasmata archaeon]|nr:mechanosensitive ion channel [Thermoplasmata archaeon]
MRRGIVLSTVLITALLLAAALSARGQDPVQILSIDTYQKTLAPGEATSFNWTVRNVDVIPYDVTVNASAEAGWTVAASPSQVANLTPSHAVAIRVTVQAPDRIEAAASVTVNVIFTVLEDGAIIYLAARTATVTIPGTFAEKQVLGLFPNPLPSPLDNEGGVFLLDIVLWAGLAGLVLLILVPLLRKLGERTKTDVGRIAIRILRTPVLVLLVLYGTIQSLSALDRYLPSWVQADALSVYQVVVALVGLYVAYRLFRDVVISLSRSIAKKTASNIDDVLVPIVEKLGVVIIGLAGLGLLLGYLNIDLTLFVAGGVVTSMVVAFAAQDSLSNFFSGIFLLTDRPFQEGDVIILSDGDWVQVRHIGMRTTRFFRFSDASIVTLPNNKLVSDKVANFTNPQDKGRVMKTFGVGYGSDPRQVKEILQEIIARSPLILQDDPYKPILRFDAMSESSLDFFVLVWLKNRDDRFTVQDYLNTEVYRAFTEAGIEIPFPQRTLHVHMEEGGEASQKKAPLDLEDRSQNPPPSGPDRERDRRGAAGGG